MRNSSGGVYRKTEWQAYESLPPTARRALQEATRQARTGGTMNIPIDSTGLLIRPMEALILDMQAQRIPISGADRLDVEEARKRITLCFQLLGSLVETQMSKLNENLSYPIDINDIMAQMADAQSDLEGRLEATEDGLS